MAIYKVKPHQSLFDIALHLYGSIEGVFDLLMTNKHINMTSDLKAGQELEYHEGFAMNDTVVQGLANAHITPANDERDVYFKRPTEDLLMIFAVNPETPVSTLVAGGEGNMIIDWGDNSELEVITLSHTNKPITHYYNSVVEKRRVRIYGNNATLQFTYLDTTDIGGTMYVTKSITVDEYRCTANEYGLDGLFLFEGTYKVNLQQCGIANLMPIADMNLQELDLRNAVFSSVSVLDDYLQYIRTHYGTRRGCTVYLTTEPSEIGMAAIRTIIGEDEWNTPIKWKFDINGTIYTAQ